MFYNIGTKNHNFLCINSIYMLLSVFLVSPPADGCHRVPQLWNHRLLPVCAHRWCLHCPKHGELPALACVAATPGVFNDETKK